MLLHSCSDKSVDMTVLNLALQVSLHRLGKIEKILCKNIQMNKQQKNDAWCDVSLDTVVRHSLHVHGLEP